jgi:NTE family protein
MVGFFQFWKKSDPKIKTALHEIPLFRVITPTELELIEKKIRRVEYKKGDIVYKLSEPAEAFYIILSGRFRVIGKGGATIGVLTQGEYFGESSILLGREHSATVEAKNDGLLLKIEKKDFQVLLKEIPSLSLHLSRTLGQRLRLGATASEISETKMISVFDFGDDLRKQQFTWNLAAMLGTDGKKKTIVVHAFMQGRAHFVNKEANSFSLREFRTETASLVQNSIREEKGSFDFIQISDGLDSELLDKQISAFLNHLIHRYDFVIIDLGLHLDEFSIKLLKQTDVLYFLVSEEMRDGSKTRAFFKEFESSLGFSKSEIKVILCDTKTDKPAKTRPFRLDDPSSVHAFHFLPHERKMDGVDVQDGLPYVLRNMDSDYSKAIRFVARELTGQLVGLALGSGAAFGFAHIGVIKVLEEEGISVDMVVGSSMGALIGSMWSSGINSKDLSEIARSLDKGSIFFKLVGFLDFTLPHRGFFKGVQVSRFLRQYLKRMTFKDVSVPIKVVAADLFTGEEVIFDQGDLVEAVRASISIPGIFTPVKRDNDFLIDGGVVDPLPIRVLTHYGVKKIIAVNVLSSAEDHVQRKEYYEEQNKGTLALKKDLNVIERTIATVSKSVQNHFRDNVFNVLMNTIQFLEYGIADSCAQDADIVIHPVLPNSHWAEFYSVDKFVKCGEQATREKLIEIKKLVDEGVA